MIKVDLNVDLRKIPSLTFPELKEYYEALFNIPTTSTRKEYYVWRITNKLQEMRFGGLDNKTRRMLENMEIKELAVAKRTLNERSAKLLSFRQPVANRRRSRRMRRNLIRIMIRIVEKERRHLWIT